jgi:hypothetical protein
MLKGTVSFEAGIRGLEFRQQPVTHRPGNPAIEGMELSIDTESSTPTVRIAVQIAQAQDEKEAIEIATQEAESALNRLSFRYGVRIEATRKTDAHFESLNPSAGGGFGFGVAAAHFSVVGHGVATAIGLGIANVQAVLQEAQPRGERLFPLFRSALQSSSDVERFMHLYNILLMLRKDSQARVDKFITHEEPRVAKTPQPPWRRPQRWALCRWRQRSRHAMETVYTRLRNEFAHRARSATDMARTKQEMGSHVVKLAQHVQTAIERFG